ncbi:MAG: methionine--tRNA ligase subunit beta [Planctomycetota bacterium]|nr:MAG: methionine--tRNA ligase subunit beta [Planctomycetota bacterium]
MTGARAGRRDNGDRRRNHDQDPRSPDVITIDDVARLDLRVGTVRSARHHPDADRLLVLEVDLGEGEPRQLVAGIKTWYTPEGLVGRQVVVVANLQPATLRGVESRGMLLAVEDASGVCVLAPERPVAPGSKVR